VRFKKSFRTSVLGRFEAPPNGGSRLRNPGDASAEFKVSLSNNSSVLVLTGTRGVKTSLQVTDKGVYPIRQKRQRGSLNKRNRQFRKMILRLVPPPTTCCRNVSPIKIFLDTTRKT
jgi:hypothetical protein